VKRKAFIKRIIDAAMILLLPVLMAEILTGQQAHGWLGTGMVLLFVLHHILNCVSRIRRQRLSRPEKGLSVPCRKKEKLWNC